MYFSNSVSFMGNRNTDSEYFDVTAVSLDASYDECAAVEGLTGSTLRPAYDLRLIVKTVIPASLESHDITIDADVSETFVEWKNNTFYKLPMNRFVHQVREKHLPT